MTVFFVKWRWNDFLVCARQVRKFFMHTKRKVPVTRSKMLRVRPRSVVFWATLWTLVRLPDPRKRMERLFVTRTPSADFFYAHEKKSADSRDSFQMLRFCTIRPSIVRFSSHILYDIRVRNSLQNSSTSIFYYYLSWALWSRFISAPSGILEKKSYLSL